jgi:hypothetical protein
MTSLAEKVVTMFEVATAPMGSLGVGATIAFWATAAPINFSVTKHSMSSTAAPGGTRYVMVLARTSWEGDAGRINSSSTVIGVRTFSAEVQVETSLLSLSPGR